MFKLLGFLVLACAVLYTQRMPLLIAVLKKVAPDMREPGDGPLGWLAQFIMSKGNVRTSISAVRKLLDQAEEKNINTFVELGPGAGYALEELKQSSVMIDRIVGVELSARFRRVLEEKMELGTIPPPLEIQTKDCKEMPYFQDESVDAMLAINVVYFLHPLEEYAQEFKRVMRRGGVALFAGKFKDLAKAKGSDFINVDEGAIVAVFKNAGFSSVTTEFVKMARQVDSYTAIIVKK